MIRAALLHLGVGFTFGALLLFNKGIALDGRVWPLLAPHIELVLLGWTMQLAMGTAFWIMPRFTGAQRYGNVRLGWATFALVNLGVIGAAFGLYIGTGSLVLIGRAGELLAAFSFVLHLWPRIKPFGETSTN